MKILKPVISLLLSIILSLQFINFSTIYASDDILDNGSNILDVTDEVVSSEAVEVNDIADKIDDDYNLDLSEYPNIVFNGNIYYIDDYNRVIRYTDNNSNEVVYDKNQALGLFQIDNALFVTTVDSDWLESTICLENSDDDLGSDKSDLSYLDELEFKASYPIKLASSGSSNEETIYNFLKSDLGLNTAAACGVLANIYKESGFNPQASCIDTNGLTSYGICQWNGGRFTSLKNYCYNNGYNYSSLSGQLNYLKYELNNGYRTQYNYMKNNISNSSQGAYDAGYYWASKFEVCASKYWDGRGSLAQNTYWARYSGSDEDNIEYYIDNNYTNTQTGYHVSGWVIATSDINKLIYSINGGAEKTYNNWLERPDVIERYPSYPKTPCGFDIALDWSNFVDGKNTVVLKAYTNGGRSMVISDVYFNIAAPSGYSISVDRNTTYTNNNSSNTAIKVSCTVSNKVKCKAKLIVEKNGSYYGAFDFGSGSNITNTISFVETGTYEIYFEISNAGGTLRGSKGNGSQTITVTDKPKQYTISYNANGGTGAPKYQTKSYGTNLTLSTTKPAKTGYVFQGWATSATATTAQYQPGEAYKTNADITLYAVWKASPISYVVSYNANGGIGAPSNQAKKSGQNLVLSSVRPTKTGYTFQGWATNATATTAQYQPGDIYSANSPLLLYAVWKASPQSNKPTIVGDNVTTGKGQTVDVKFVIKNNPGIASMGFDVNYNTSAMTLASVKVGNVFTSSEITEGVINKNPYTVSALCVTGNKTKNGTLVTMTFNVKPNCATGVYDIKISNYEAFNIDEKPVNIGAVNGSITVSDSLKGDVNSDNVVNRNDLLRLGKYFAGQNLEINKSSSDVNNDGIINRNDLLRLGKYFAGWDVKLG